MGFVWVCTQIVGSVVLCEFDQRFFNSCFHFYERGLLSCDTQIVCVYEVTCSVVVRLPRHMERTWGDSNLQIFTELPVPPQAARVVGTV